VSGVSEARRAELSDSLTALRERIDAACAAAGRATGEVGLLAVTKTFPAADVAALCDLGLRAFGENRAQEAAPKVAELAELRPDVDARWHMVGQLQRNKARSVAGWAHQVQSVDSQRLVTALGKASATAIERGERTGPLGVLLQVSLDERPDRGGCLPEEVPELAEGVARTSELELHGLMAVAPLNEDPEPAFARLAEIAARLRRDHPGATELSAGMSGDLETAIAYGSTCVRVGTALLGGRQLASQ
jgi:pyridoxal phosphate enzyme (YggS family)